MKIFNWNINLNATIANIIVTLTFFSPSVAQEKGNASGLIIESPYEVVSDWLKPFQKKGYAFGGNSAIWAENPDRILINQRGETILPNQLPENFPGFAGALGINDLKEPDRRVWQN